MPELPEVETTRRGIAPHVTRQPLTDVIVRDSRLRWPVPRDLRRRLVGRAVHDVGRRAKYLLLDFAPDTVIIHLGMSGSLRVITDGRAALKHDHVEFAFANGARLRFSDPRRFGSVHVTDDPAGHWLLEPLGPEPTGEAFSGRYLHDLGRRRKTPVKHFLMDSRVVAGVGNIYACEALHAASIHPLRAAGRVSRRRYDRLADAVKAVLALAIEAGGTTLRDFVNVDGEPGYFSLRLNVYAREGLGCPRCNTPIRRITQGQRGTWYCPGCQR